MNEIKLSGQQQKIFDYMNRHGGRITNREIMEKLQINGATARISEIRRKLEPVGIHIKDRPLVHPTTGASYKEYYIEAEGSGIG